MAVVELRGLKKTYDGGKVRRRLAHAQVHAVDGVDLATTEGEYLVLLGPSGCGKTTLLRTIAGLEQPTEGEVWIGGHVVNELPPRARRVAMVFQSYALYPHKTVRANIVFPLRAAQIEKAERARKVEWAAELLGITRLLDRRPRQLSGGERQRVALARALVRDPSVFLLDEPLSNLDAKLRASARDELKRFQQQVETTTIYVTHDQVEAMGLGDRIAVMYEGRLRQLGPGSARRRTDRVPARAPSAGLDRARRRPARRTLPGRPGGAPVRRPAPVRHRAGARRGDPGDRAAADDGHHRSRARRGARVRRTR